MFFPGLGMICIVLNTCLFGERLYHYKLCISVVVQVLKTVKHRVFNSGKLLSILHVCAGCSLVSSGHHLTDSETILCTNSSTSKPSSNFNQLCWVHFRSFNTFGRKKKERSMNPSLFFLPAGEGRVKKHGTEGYLNMSHNHFKRMIYLNSKQ